MTAASAPTPSSRQEPCCGPVPSCPVPLCSTRKRRERVGRPVAARWPRSTPRSKVGKAALQSSVPLRTVRAHDAPPRSGPDAINERLALRVATDRRALTSRGRPGFDRARAEPSVVVAFAEPGLVAGAWYADDLIGQVVAMLLRVEDTPAVA